MCKGAICDGSCACVSFFDAAQVANVNVKTTNSRGKKVSKDEVSKPTSILPSDFGSLLNLANGTPSVTFSETTANTKEGVPVNRIPFGAKGSLIGNRYKCERTIGRGSYGKVKQALDNVTGLRVAIKFSNGSEKANFLISREIECMRNLKHPCIVGYVDDFYDEVSGAKCLVMEYYSSDLFSVVSSAYNGCFPEKYCYRIMQQLLSALEYLHVSGIAHRDLKPENILLDCDDLAIAHVKICDFGLARSVSSNDGLMQTKCGSEAFVAPEVFYQDRYYGQKADIWSFGVLVFSLITGFNAWAAPTMEDALFQTYVTNPLRFWQWAQGHMPNTSILSEHFVAFLTQCMDINVERRWNASTAMQFLLLAGCAWDPNEKVKKMVVYDEDDDMEEESEPGDDSDSFTLSST